MRKFFIGLMIGVLLGLTSSVVAQHLSRTTPIAGGPPQAGFLGDYDSTMTVLPISATLVTANTILVQNIYCHNAAGTAQTVSITDNQATPKDYVKAATIAANSTQQFINGGKGVQMLGIKWNSNLANSISCQISGYQ